MAIINKIRDNSGVALVVVAVALLFFIVGGDIFSGNQAGGIFGNMEDVGEIAGKKIDYKQFVSKVDESRTQYERGTGQAAGEQEIAQIRNQVWEQFIFDNAFEDEFNELGIEVTPAELSEMIQGATNMHPLVKQQFSDQAGNFDAASHKQFIDAIANKTVPVEQLNAWAMFKKSLISQRKMEKYQNILNRSTYVTSLEAKKEYDLQNKTLDADYLFVPFYSLSDTTITVSDSEVKSYFSSHKSDFVGIDNRELDYVSFQIVPSKEDSAQLNAQILDLAKGLASAADPVSYANLNSDEKMPEFLSKNQLSAEVISKLNTSIEGSVVGPFKEGNLYSIYKYLGIERDSLYSARASHILFQANSSAPDSVKNAARAKALEVLAQIKKGADFASLARVHGSDGTKDTGGDLGYFQNNGQMVKEFENAIFNFKGQGLIPNLVVTDFGYHIVKVTDAKSNQKYKLATISKILEPSEASRNVAFEKADNLRKEAKSIQKLKDAALANPEIVVLNAKNVAINAKGVNSLTNARELVKWAYNDDTKAGAVADKVFILDDSYVIAGLVGGSDKNDPKASDFEDRIKSKLLSIKRGEKIVEKLKGSSGTLQEIASAYGSGALVESVSGINFKTGLLNSGGVDPLALGTAFGLKEGATSKPFAGDNGVYIFKTKKVSSVPEIADYSKYKTEIISNRAGMSEAYIASQALRENADIVDNREKLF